MNGRLTGVSLIGYVVGALLALNGGIDCGMVGGVQARCAPRRSCAINLWFGAMGPLPRDRAFYIPFTTPVADRLDRRFAADFFGIKTHIIVTEDWCYNNEDGEVEPPQGRNTLLPVFESGDYYRWVPLPIPTPRTRWSAK